MPARDDIIECSAIVATFAAALALSHPHGNFPLNDDGFYAEPAFELAKTGHYTLSVAVLPSLRAQLYWGAAFVRLFGATYDVLRFSTMVAGALALIVINRILARTTLSRPLRILATLAFAFHPVLIWASCTFMTEVHFLLASVIAFALYVRGLKDDRPLLLVAAGAAVAWSWWIRQTGIGNALPPLALLLLERERLTMRWRRDLLLCALPVALFGAIYLTRPALLMGSPQEFETHWDMWRQTTFRLPQQLELIASYTLLNFRACAVFFLPLTAVLFRRVRSRADAAWLFAALAIVFLGMWQLTGLLPYPKPAGGHVLFNLGLGPLTLPDVWTRQRPYPFALPPPAQTAFAVAAGILTAIFLSTLAKNALDERRTSRGVVLSLALLYAVINTAALCASSSWFDRYSLSSAWPLGIAAALIVTWTTPRQVIAIALLVMLALFDITSLDEYFAYQRARWRAFNGLVRAGVAVTDITAGNEPFAIYEVARATTFRARRKLAVTSGLGRRYAIAFGPMKGYRVIARTPFTSWFALRRAEIVTLARE
jgi:hypothetical protein